MAARGRRRPPDPARVRVALTAQWRALVERVERMTPEELAAPSRLAGWSNHELVTHIALGASLVGWYLAAPYRAPASAPTPASVLASAGRPDVDLAAWAAGTHIVADDVDKATREAAAGGFSLAEAVGAAEAAMTGVPDERRIGIRFGTMRLGDFLVTRLVEAVVHADDLDPAFPHDREALATVVRTLTDLLAAGAPGQAVELRIPPYAVVQCIQGPRHTRGTPPNVVETDPLTWLRLATGRLSWAEALATGQVAASGDRADLAPYVPLLR
jgi:uncharacterized protein (TIGR03083 family)